MGAEGPGASLEEIAKRAGVEETLTCEKCGSEFSRVSSRGRKPKECPSCRE